MESINEKIFKADRGDEVSALEVCQIVLWEEDGEIEEMMLKRVKNYLADAVDNGNGIAMRMVGDMYAKARGVEKDMDKASFWYEKAASLGVTDAVEKLKEIKPQELDYEKLFKDYAKAAMDGDGLGYFRIGQMYEEGNFVPQSNQEALSCFYLAHKLACNDKFVEYYPDLCMKIGEYLYKGIGCERSILDARKFFEEANDYYRIQVNKGDNSKKEDLKHSQEALDEVDAVFKSGCNGVI